VLTDPTGLDMVETIHHIAGSQLSATPFHGSKPMDAIWVTCDVDVTNACAMPVGYGIGDHQPFIINLHLTSLVGPCPQPIKCPIAWRLETKIVLQLKIEALITCRQLKLNLTHQMPNTHFSHYVVGAYFNTISDLHALT